MADTGSGGGSPTRVIPASRWYSRILVIVTILMFVCLGLWVGMSIGIPNPTTSQADTIDNISKAFFGCLGTLVGTVGGKVT